MTEELDAIGSLLYDVGSRMKIDVMKSEHLSRQKKMFLSSWGDRLQAMAEWVFAQKDADLLGAWDILHLVQLETEMARQYRERESSLA